MHTILALISCPLINVAAAAKARLHALSAQSHAPKPAVAACTLILLAAAAKGRVKARLRVHSEQPHTPDLSHYYTHLDASGGSCKGEGEGEVVRAFSTRGLRGGVCKPDAAAPPPPPPMRPWPGPGASEGGGRCARAACSGCMRTRACVRA
eukprot:1160592-Pelagomonas_calceolata.AAC.6